MWHLLKKEFLLGISIVFMLTLICVMEPIIVCSEDIQPDSSISDSSFPTKKGKEQVVNSDNNQNEISDSNNNKTISGSKEETDPTSESINKVEGKQNSEKSDSRESMPSDDSESIKDSKENSSVKVSNYKEFKDALLNKNIRTIYLDKDIKILESFNFSSNKDIYGNGHIIDMNFQSIGIALKNANCKISDIKLTNQPIYPLFWSEYPGVTVDYTNVSSTGYQFIYLSAGTANLEGEIEATATAEEVFQGKHININKQANVYFNDTSGANAIYTGDGINIEEGSNLIMNAMGLGLYMYKPNGAINIAGNVQISSQTNSAIRSDATGGEMNLQEGATLKAYSKGTDEEAILLCNGSIVVKKQANLEVTSEGYQSTVQTGNKLELLKGSNFLISNRKGNALGAWTQKTSVSLSSSKGIDTWKVGSSLSEDPDKTYKGPLTASFILDTYVPAQHTTNVISNNIDFQKSFDSGDVGTIAGGDYVKRKEIAPTTIEELTNESTEVKGTAEPNAHIEAKINNRLITSGKVDGNGIYQLSIPRQKAGTVIDVVASIDGLYSENSTVVKYVGPSISIPNAINFGKQEIPPVDKLITASDSQSIDITDNSLLKDSTWKLSVKEDQRLINEKKEQLFNRILFNKGNKKITINAQDQIVAEGKGNKEFSLDKHMYLSLHPSDKIGMYEGELTGTFIVAPS